MATSETVNYSFGSQLPSNDTHGFSEAYQGTLGARVKLAGKWELEGLYRYGHYEERSTSQYGIDNAALNAALARTDPATALNPFSTQPNNPAALQNLATQLFIAPGDTNFQGWELKVDVQSAYAEVLIPFFGADNARAGESGSSPPQERAVLRPRFSSGIRFPVTRGRCS